MATAAELAMNPAQSNHGTLQLKQTKRGEVYVGELSADFLRIPAPQPQGGAQAAPGTGPQAMFAPHQQMMTQPMPMVTSHRILITIIEAKLNKSYGMTKMDPYCRLRIGHGIFETPTATSGGKMPYWGKTWSSVVSADIKHIELEVYDERAFSTDSRVAWTTIPISEEIRKGKSQDSWWPLNGKLGDEKEGSVHLQVSMRQEQRPMYQQMMMPQMMMPAPGYVIPPGVQIGGPGLIPPQPQGPPPITEEDLKQMKEMFPDTDNDVIKTVLEASGGNKDAAINSLLTMQC